MLDLFQCLESNFEDVMFALFLVNYFCCNNYYIYSILLWITNFLNNRKQRVVVDGSFSNYADVESGVPQGTVLGPLLFLPHINDLPSCVNSKVRLFADDCLLYREIKK